MNAQDDKNAITELLIRYTATIDRRDWPTFHTVFTADADLDYGPFGSYRGADKVTESMDKAHRKFGHTLHRLSNVVVELIETDKATTRSYVDALLLNPDGNCGRQIVGFYDDEVVRGDSGWQIGKRRFTRVLMSEIGDR